MTLDTSVSDSSPRHGPDRPRSRSSGAAVGRVLPFVAIAAASLGGPVLLIATSSHGVHTTPDSFTYLGAASNLANGRGWTYPFGVPGAAVTLFPPLYPLLLSGGYLLGVNELAWALWLNAAMFGVLLAIAGLGVYRSTDGSLVTAIAAIAFAALGVPPLLAYSSVLSESLFYPAELLALFLFGEFLRTRRTRLLVLAGIATSVSMLTRYAGLSLFLTACGLLALWPGRRVVERIRLLAIYAATSLALNLVWSIRNIATADTLTGDKNLVHGLTLSDVTDGLRVVSAWFFTRPFPGPVGLELVMTVSLAVAVGVPIVTAAARGRAGTVRVPPTAAVLLVFPFVHFLFLAAANVFSPRTPPLNDRMLGPAYLSLALGVLLVGHAVWTGSVRGRVPARVLLASGLIAALVIVGVGAHTYIGSEVSREKQSADELVALGEMLRPVVGEHPGAAVYGNTANATWAATGSAVLQLPRPCSGHDRIPSPTYESELATLGDQLRRVPAIVVVFTGTRSAGFGARACPNFSLTEVESTLRLVETHSFPGIVILGGA